MTRLSRRDAEIAATARALFEYHRTHPVCARCGQPTEMSKGGWQRICPSCGRSHFPRTDPVVIMLITCGNDVLVGRSPHWPDGMFSLLAGFIEPGETIENAVRREVKEESDIDVGKVSYLGSQPWAFPASLMIGCHGDALSKNITLDPVELAEAKWVSKEERLATMASKDQGLQAAREGAIAHHLIKNWVAGKFSEVT